MKIIEIHSLVHRASSRGKQARIVACRVSVISTISHGGYARTALSTRESRRGMYLREDAADEIALRRPGNHIRLSVPRGCCGIAAERRRRYQFNIQLHAPRPRRSRIVSPSGNEKLNKKKKPEHPDAIKNARRSVRIIRRSRNNRVNPWYSLYTETKRCAALDREGIP